MLLFDLNLYNILFVFLASSIIIFIIKKIIITKPKVDVKIVEKWGEYLPSKTGISWGVPRLYFGKVGLEDSRPLLEKYGFTVLGIANEVLYRVEPPINWRLEGCTHLLSFIYNEKGVQVLVIFIKNDIMNLSDYRGYIYVV